MHQYNIEFHYLVLIFKSSVPVGFIIYSTPASLCFFASSKDSFGF